MEEGKVHYEKEALEMASNWWYCVNTICYPLDFALIRTSEPRCFVMMDAAIDIRDSREFCKHAHVGYFNAVDAETVDDEDIKKEAWQFMIMNRTAELKLADMSHLKKDAN